VGSAPVTAAGLGRSAAFEESVEAAHVVRPGSTRVPAATRTRLDTTTVTEAWNASHAPPPQALATLVAASVPARGEPLAPPLLLRRAAAHAGRRRGLSR